ncbi:D-aminoacyl-tRNA deacylase [Candidatus Moduliflexota bacterium]
MKAVLQRVRSAAVAVDGRKVSGIDRGILVLLGVAAGDGREQVEWLAGKVSRLRIFADEEGKMSRSVEAAGGEILVVSQFTLLADCRKGNRPSFGPAAPPGEGERLYRWFVEEVRRLSSVPVREGVFGAMMDVSLVNDGPVTFVLDTPS